MAPSSRDRKNTSKNAAKRRTDLAAVSSRRYGRVRDIKVFGSGKGAGIIDLDKWRDQGGVATLEATPEEIDAYARSQYGGAWERLPSGVYLREKIESRSGKPIFYHPGSSPEIDSTRDALNSTIKDSVKRAKRQLAERLYNDGIIGDDHFKWTKPKKGKKPQIKGLSDIGLSYIDTKLTQLGLSADDLAGDRFLLRDIDQDNRMIEDYNRRFNQDFPGANRGGITLGASQLYNIEMGRFGTVKKRRNIGSQNDHWRSLTDVADYIYDSYLSPSARKKDRMQEAPTEVRALWDKVHSRTNYAAIPADFNLYFGGLVKRLLLQGRDPVSVGAMGRELGGLTDPESAYQTEYYDMAERHWNIPETEEFREWSESPERQAEVERRRVSRLAPGKSGPRIADKVGGVGMRLLGGFMDPADMFGATFNTPSTLGGVQESDRRVRPREGPSPQATRYGALWGKAGIPRR